MTEGLGERAADAFGNVEGLADVAHVRDEDGELVAAQSGHGVLGAYDGREPLTDQLQQRVTDLVTKGVVDLLEAVQVEEEQRDAEVGVVRGLDPRPRVLDQQLAVGQAGERVVVGLTLFLQRHCCGRVDREEREQQQGHQPGAAFHDHDDDRAEAEQSAGRGDLVAPVGEELGAELGVLVKHQRLRDEGVVAEEEDDACGGDARKVVAVNGQRVQRARMHSEDPQCCTRGAEGKGVLADVERRPPRCLVPGRVGDDGGDGLHQQRDRETPVDEKREDKGGRRADAIRIR